MKRGMVSLFLVFIFSTLLFSKDATKAPEEFKKIAKEWADEYFPGTIDKGTLYYTSSGNNDCWVFVINKQNKAITNNEQLRNSIKSFYDLKKEAENELKIANSSKDAENINKWSNQINENMKKIRNAAEYATVFVFQGENKPYVGMSFNGLPPHIVSYFDVESLAKTLLNTETPIEGEYFFLGFNDMFIGFKNNEKGYYINMLQKKFILPDTLFNKLCKLSLKKDRLDSFNPNSNILKTTYIESEEKIIGGVPKYYSRDEDDHPIFYRGCVPVSVAMVLGYWNDHGYERLIDGDDDEPSPHSMYEGSLDTLRGYLGLINQELADVLHYDRLDFNTDGFSLEEGKNALLQVCNNSKYKNYYDFSATLHTYDNDNDVDASWDTYYQEIKYNNRPFVMDYGKYLLTLDSILVAQLLQHPNLPIGDNVAHAVCAVGYKYINYAASRTDRWRLVHMNGGIFEDPVYLNDYLFSDSLGGDQSSMGLLTVVPGSNAWEGEYNQNKTWSGKVRIIGNLTFNTGTTLTIEGGTNVILENENVHLEIDNLVILGNVTFTNLGNSEITITSDLSIPANSFLELEAQDITFDKKVIVNSNAKLVLGRFNNVTFNDDVTVSYTTNYVGYGDEFGRADLTFMNGGLNNIIIKANFNVSGQVNFWESNVELEQNSIFVVAGKLFCYGAHFYGPANSLILYNSNFTADSWALDNVYGPEIVVCFMQNASFNNGSINTFNKSIGNVFNGTTNFNVGSTCTFGDSSKIDFIDDVHIYGNLYFGAYSNIKFYEPVWLHNGCHFNIGQHSKIWFLGGIIIGGDLKFFSNSEAHFEAPVSFLDGSDCSFSTNSIATFTNKCIIDSAATVNFDHANLFVNDSLLVYGQFWADNCTIDFGNDTTKAQGIVFEGEDASRSRITDSIVRDCMDGITIINSSPLIKTSEFLYMEKRGFNIIGIDSEPEIRQCYIHLTGTYPLQMLSEADPTLVDNRFYGNGKCGARIWGADGTFTRNEFRSNNESGVFMFSSTASPQFYSFADSGGNMFDMSNIATQAVFIGGGNPMFGDYPSITGNNIFQNRGTRYYIYNDTPGNIIAELSWWADGTGTGSYYNADGGNVDYSPKLDTEPPAGPLLLKTAVSPFISGFEKYRQKDYAGAMAELKQQLQQDKSSLKADQAVFRLGKAARKIGRLGELESFLGDLKKEKDPQIQYHSRNWLCYLYASRNDMKSAEKLLDEVPKGSSYERTMLLDICSYYASLKDMKNAERIAGILKERHNNEVLEMELEAALEGWIDFNQVKGQTKVHRRGASIPIPQPYIAEQTETPVPADTVAFKAGIYPNPFNSSTTINFDVEKDGPVQIAIYDLLGRHVQTLVDDRRTAGSYRAVWNGCDYTGRSVASGIYFVRMQTGSKVQSFKISYIK